MKGKNEQVLIPVDDEYYILADNLNWVVWERHPSMRGKRKGEIIETPEAWCHDVEGAIKAIIRLKALRDVEYLSIEDYLNWEVENLTLLTKLVFENKTALLEASELNKVM